MITIIHGDDTNASRKFFIDKRKDSKTPILNGETVSLLDIKQVGSTGGLFEKSEPIFIEGFFSNVRPGKKFDEITSFLKTSKDIDIYFWEPKEIGKKMTSSVGTPILETFKIPQNTFGFLDGIRPGEGKRNVELFHSALVASNEDLLFFMIVRQFRLLLGVSTNAQIEEVKRLAPWQKNKLFSQAKNFSKENLLAIHKRLNDIDFGMKTGGLAMSLTDTVDFFLLDL